MTTTKANMEEVVTASAALADRLDQLAADFPGPCPPSLPVDSGLSTLASVRSIFDHGGEWATRVGWQAALNRLPRRRSIWLPKNPDQAVSTAKGLVGGAGTDNQLIIAVWPFADATTAGAPPLAFYDNLARTLDGVPDTAVANTWWRFGWEPNGGWYPHGYYPSTGFNPIKYDLYIDAWAAFARRFPQTQLVLNLSGDGEVRDPARSEQVVRDVLSVAPALGTFSFDAYAMEGMRDPIRLARLITSHRELAGRYLLKWAVDETSPFVNKVKGGSQVGALDTAQGIAWLHTLVQEVQRAHAHGDSPRWVQLFERNSAEGQFSVVSVQASASTGAFYRAADGNYRYSTAPRIASHLVSLLGNPQ